MLDVKSEPDCDNAGGVGRDNRGSRHRGNPVEKMRSWLYLADQAGRARPQRRLCTIIELREFEKRLVKKCATGGGDREVFQPVAHERDSAQSHVPSHPRTGTVVGDADRLLDQPRRIQAVARVSYGMTATLGELAKDDLRVDVARPVDPSLVAGFRDGPDDDLPVREDVWRIGPIRRHE